MVYIDRLWKLLYHLIRSEDYVLCAQVVDIPVSIEDIENSRRDIHRARLDATLAMLSAAHGSLLSSGGSINRERDLRESRLLFDAADRLERQLLALRNA